MKKHLFTAGLSLLVSMAPALAQDFPANPLEKEGYRLIFNDEFDGTEIDRTKWVPEYLPSWSNDRDKRNAIYDMKDGILSLRIDKKGPWKKGEFCCTGFMSASRTGLHRFDPKRKPVHFVKTEAPQINQYGYYEMRAKMQPGGGVHCAWWLVGFQDTPDQSCEIDIFEILGKEVDRIWSTVHAWKDASITYHTECPWFANKKLGEEFHNYGFDWTPEGVTVYVDGIRTMSHKAVIPYPLIQIISLYDNRRATEKDWTGPFDSSTPYPKRFDIDYIRMYKKIPEGFSAVKKEDLRITKIEPARLNITPEEAVISNIDGHITPEVLHTPTFVHVHYNDGTVTQQFVEWEPVNDEIMARIKRPGTVIIDGKITGLSDELLKGQQASLIITTRKAEVKK